MINRILVTGGAGFIGSSVVKFLINRGKIVLNLDKLTYAGNLESVSDVSNNINYTFIKQDICNSKELIKIFMEFKPDAVIHLAAESHVDNSINNPEIFIQTNIVGTFNLLEATRRFLNSINNINRRQFRFLYVSTDEVYGSIGTGSFTEKSNYNPRSPYSSSKASAENLVSAWHHTYDIPTIITHCSNNFGPFQHKEKLIPKIILNSLKLETIPIYGDGKNIRDWIYVDDHVKALLTVLEHGFVGETYNIGAGNEKTNKDIVFTICGILDYMFPRKDGYTYKSLIRFVSDRLGHDRRYSVDSTKIMNQLNWKPEESFESGIKKTILWYKDNMF